MTGTIFEELKKNDLNKKKEKLKFITAVLLTNILVALSSWSLFADSPSEGVLKRPEKTLHPHHKMIIAPLTVLSEISADSVETPVTLMSKNKKILVQKAYLHEEVRPKNAEEMGTTRFKIEIPDEEVLKLSEELLDSMIAIPEVKLNRPGKAVTKRISKYEMVF
jgi:hypothetical protein